MKASSSIFVVAFLALQVHAGATDVELSTRYIPKKDLEYCEKESRLAFEAANQYFREGRLAEDNSKVHTFIGCITEKVGAIDLNGVAVYDKIVDLVVYATEDDEDNIFTDMYLKYVLHLAVERCRAPFKQLATPGQTAIGALSCVRIEFNATAKSLASA